MPSNCVIRKINWKNCDKNGVPRDFLDIKKFFNKGLKTKSFDLVRRRNKITYFEIKKIWLNSKSNTITYVAYSKKDGHVVGSGTVFSEGYKGEFHITLDPEHLGKGLGIIITKKTIDEALKRKITVIVDTSIENKGMISVMKKLGYGHGKRIKNYDPYVNNIKAKTFDVYQWRIKPK